MTYYATTWNSQGDPTDPNQGLKNQVLTGILSKSQIVLLQECGHLANIHNFIGQNDIVQLGPQAGSFNPRCSTAIISKMPGTFDQIYLQSGTGRSAIILYPDTGPAVATLHAISGGIGAQDLAQVITEMNRHNDAYVVGGDFNTTPEGTGWEIGRHKMRIGSSRHPIEFQFIAPQLPTHQGGQVLDWYVYEGTTLANVGRWHTQGGDHYPVYVQVG